MPVKEKKEKTKKAEIKHQTPWEKLPIKIDLNRYITRQVLNEKWNEKKSKEILMTDFFISKLHNCELFINKYYPNSVFYIKKIKTSKGTEQEILMEKHEKNQYFYIKYRDFWSVFEIKYGLNYSEIQQFTEHWLETLLKSQGYKTTGHDFTHIKKLETLLKSQGYKTHNWCRRHRRSLETLLKSQGYKTMMQTAWEWELVGDPSKITRV